MLGGLRREADGFLDLLFPPLCLLCRAPLGEHDDRSLCSGCRAGFLPLLSPCCPVCALPFATLGGSDHCCGECLQHPPAFVRTIAAGLYEETLRHAIHCFKFDGLLGLDRPLARLLIQAWTRAQLPALPDLLVPVPLHPERLRQRTYNQSLLIAREVGRELGLAVAPRLLARRVATRPQAGLTARERQHNLHHAFCLNRPLQGERILLIDDVMTTAATARSCAQVLKDGGAGEVTVAVLGRARRHSPHGLGLPAMPDAIWFGDGD